MDILSIIALGKANKALKGGGSSSSGVAYYEFTVELNGSYYDVTTDATVSAILEDISNGKLPIAIIHQEGYNDAFAYIREYEDGNVYFVTMPNVMKPENTLYCYVLDYDSHDSEWIYTIMPGPDA